MASKHKGECMVPLKGSSGESSCNLHLWMTTCNTSIHASLEDKRIKSYWEKNLDNRILKAHRLCKSGSMRHKAVNIHLNQNKS